MKNLTLVLVCFCLTIPSLAMEKKMENSKSAAGPVIDKKNDSNKKDIVAKPIPRVWFSPGIKKLIASLIDNELEGITCAVYKFTLYDLAGHFICRNNDINFKPYDFVIDKSYNTDFIDALRMLLKDKATIYSCNENSAKDWKQFNMHHKFIIFNKNSNGRPLALTGSFNFTGQAETSWENVVLIEDEESIDLFRKEFAKISDRQYSTPIAISDLKSTKKVDSKVGLESNNIPERYWSNYGYTKGTSSGFSTKRFLSHKSYPSSPDNSKEPLQN